MKKKEYIAPSMDVVEIKNMQLLAGSGVTADGIDYGGVDDEGTLDPTAPGLEIDPLSELFAF
jgi:hypothetical protein